MRLLDPLFALLAAATDHHLARMVEYLRTENRILRSKLPARVTVTPRERARLVKLGTKLGGAIKDLITIVSRTWSPGRAGWTGRGSGCSRAPRWRPVGRTSYSSATPSRASTRASTRGDAGGQQSAIGGQGKMGCRAAGSLTACTDTTTRKPVNRVGASVLLLRGHPLDGVPDRERRLLQPGAPRQPTVRRSPHTRSRSRPSCGRSTPPGRRRPPCGGGQQARPRSPVPRPVRTASRPFRRG
jgi:hypothetical protein